MGVFDWSAPVMAVRVDGDEHLYPSGMWLALTPLSTKSCTWKCVDAVDGRSRQQIELGGSETSNRHTALKHDLESKQDGWEGAREIEVQPRGPPHLLQSRTLTVILASSFDLHEELHFIYCASGQMWFELGSVIFIVSERLL